MVTAEVEKRETYPLPSCQVKRPRRTRRSFGLVHISEILPSVLAELQSGVRSKVKSKAEEVAV